MNPSVKILGSLLTFIFILSISIFVQAGDQIFEPPMESREGEIFDASDENLEDWVTMEDKTVIDAPIGLVSLFFTDIKKTITMTPGLKDKKVLESFTENNRIDYDHFKLFWPFQDRFMIYRAIKKYNNGDEILIKMDSVENYPYEEEDKVRASLGKSFILLKSSAKNEFKTTVTIKMQINPGGWLPNWLVKFHTDSWTQELFKNLREDIQGYLNQEKKSKGTLPQQAETAPE